MGDEGMTMHVGEVVYSMKRTSIQASKDEMRVNERRTRGSAPSSP